MRALNSRVKKTGEKIALNAPPYGLRWASLRARPTTKRKTKTATKTKRKRGHF
jgi:hypothetical protein